MFGDNCVSKISPKFISDGETRYKLSDFITKNANEVKLTNDERKQLLTIFNPKKRVHSGILLLAIAFFTLIMGITFCAIMRVIESLLGTVVCLLPSIILFIAGIYMISTAPNIEKSVIKAYEFTVENMKHMYLVRVTRHSKYYQTEDLTYITLQTAVRYGLGGKVGAVNKYFLYLQLDGKWVEIANAESYSPIRFGIKIGDKVRCAVLEYGKYCYISLY